MVDVGNDPDVPDVLGLVHQGGYPLHDLFCSSHDFT
jgi:hypothetical protein